MIFNNEINSLIKYLGEENELNITYKNENEEGTYCETIRIEGFKNFKISLKKHKDVVSKNEYWTKTIWCTDVNINDEYCECEITNKAKELKEKGAPTSISRKYKIKNGAIYCTAELLLEDEFEFEFEFVISTEYEVYESDLFLSICDKYLKTINFEES